MSTTEPDPCDGAETQAFHPHLETPFILTLTETDS